MDNLGGKYALIVVVILSAWDFDAPQELLKLRMKSNSFQAMAEAVTLATDKVNVIFYTTRLLIICGQMFRQQRVEAGMLEF